MAIYGSLEDANAYHAARGNAAWTAGADADKLAALQRATDYIDGRYRYQTAGGWLSMFRGVRTDGRAQDLEWPRTGATDSEGNEIPVDEVPIEVQHATYEAALIELATPGSLSPSFTPSQQVIREKVGPIEVGYAEPTGGEMPPNRPIVSLIDDLLAGLIVAWPVFGVGVRVV